MKILFLMLALLASSLTICSATVVTESRVNLPRAPWTADTVISSYDFGHHSSLEDSAISHDFMLTNRDEVSITLTRFHASCGCTVGTVAGGPDQPNHDLPIILLPGASVCIHVSVDPTRLWPGRIDKTLSVYAEGRVNPVAILEVTGLLAPAASIMPSVLNFGTERVYNFQPLILTVVYAKGILDKRDQSGATAEMPYLVSSDPDIHIELITRRQDTNRHQPTPVQVGLNDTDTTQIYRVSISPQAHLGILDGSVTLFRTGRSPISADPILGATVPFAGEVVGSVSASPSAVAFGSVPANLSRVIRIILTANTPGALKGLTLFSTHSSVTARLIRGDDKVLAQVSSPDQATLEVTYRPNVTTPPITGTLESQILVTTAMGERLILPVSVSVSE